MATLFGMVAELVRILVTLTWPLSDLILDFFYSRFIKTRRLPPVTNKLLLLSASELADRIRRKQVSCEEVMLAYVDRSRQVHECINAAVDDRYEAALIDARNVDKMLATGSLSQEQMATETPLLGVPFSCKEAIGVKGMSQTAGIVSEKNHIAEKDGAAAAQYRKAGAIPYVVTSVPELLMWWESSNQVTGFTRNPYDNRRTVGGSSGGEGTLITSAAALIGIGNDIAGSIRIPAAFTGIYGHKPSRNIINNWGTYPYSYMTDKPEFQETENNSNDYVSTGPMCRYARDLPLLTKVLSDTDNRIKWGEKVNFRNIKVYYLEEFPGFLNRAVPDVKGAVMKAVKHFEDKFGITATPLDVPELAYGLPIWECKLLETGMPPFRDHLATTQKDGSKTIDLFWEFQKWIMGKSDHTLPAIYFAVVDRRKKDRFYYRCIQMFTTLQQKMNEIFSENAILIVPTHPEPPPHYLMTVPKYPNIAYTCIFSILGLPCTQIPAGLSKGLPIGLQAISGPLKDHLTIATALELDKVFHGWISPCPITV